jgi:hypothetical protein
MSSRLIASSLILIALLFAMLVAGPVCAQADPAIQARFDALMSIEESSRGASTKERAEALTEAFSEQFPTVILAQLSGLSDADLELVFRAANVANFYTQTDEHLKAMRTAFDALDERGLIVRRTFADMYGAAMAARQFGRARELARAYNQWTVEPPPELYDEPGGAATALEIKGEGILKRLSLGVQDGSYIVVISHPLCHFSRRAVAAIDSDIELSKALEGAVWMAPVDRSLRLDVLNDWNRNHPERKMVIAYSRKAWPQLDSWSTPTFYFLKDNKVVHIVEGWPEEGRKSEIIRAARVIGR